MSDDDDDFELSAEDHRFIGMLARAARSEIAHMLLSGNDTGCFTTEQYRIAYERKNLRHLFSKDKLPLLWQYVSPEDALRSIPGVVREVGPGVWAAVEVQNARR
jgi:hypothetical protein